MTRAERYEVRNRNEAFIDEVGSMFARGESYTAISKATGIPRSTVEKMCGRLTANYVNERYGDAKSALGRELFILDALTRKNLSAAVRGNSQAAKIVLDAHVRRCKLLGLEAAVKAEIVVKTATDIEIERLTDLLTGRESGFSGLGEGGGSLDPVGGAGDSAGDDVAGMAGGSE